MVRLPALTFLVVAITACAQSPAPTGQPTPRPMPYPGGEGQFAISAGSTGTRPGVLVLAPPDSLKSHAAQFANLGYACLAIAPVEGDRSGSAKRCEAALGVLAKNPQVAGHRVALIGFGTGGTAVLDHARSGNNVVGVAAIHPDSFAPTGSPASRNITARVLVVMGSDDPQLPLAQLASFESEMKATRADFDVLRIGGVAGSFTSPSAKTYDADAESRAMAAVKQLLAELFPPQVRSFGGATAANKKAAPSVPGVPEKALKVLKHIDDHDRAPDGFEGGRNFGNFERRLPQTDHTGRRIRYREWDVNPLRPGVNRGAERLVTGSDGSAYYTDDHYETFKKIRS